MKALFDHHHQQLSQALIYLFEKRLGIELYRPKGDGWYPNYYWHPIAEEAQANLTPSSANEFCEPAPDRHAWNKWSGPGGYYDQDNLRFRWLPFERIQEIDYLVCTTDRNEQRFADLKRNLGLKCKILRYIGNREESVNPANFDIGLFATLKYYRELKDTKPCVLYHPEFDTKLYHASEPMPLLRWPGDMGQVLGYRPVVRNWLNFTWHHRERGSPWETWHRYHGYCNEFGYTAICHGLGTPPPDVKVEMDVILDTCFDRMGRPDLKDRSTWPDLRWNQGEPQSHAQIAQLMGLSNMAVHIKRGSEGFGFVIHCLAAMGRPPIVEQDAYRELSAYRFLQHRETCLFVSGHEATDKENLRWAMEPENNTRMAQRLYLRFLENVDFQAEAHLIRQLL